MRFTVFTHVIHQESQGKYYAYSPYVREMNLWFKYVEEVEILSHPGPPLKKGGELSAGLCYEFKGKIKFTWIASFNFLNTWNGVKAIIKIPVIFYKIISVMWRADHLHLRCPGNIGLLAAIAQIFFPKKSKTVKYAGNWDPEAKQPWTYRLQKWILSNTFLSKNIKVLVYGDWPNQSDNILPFFTASFSEKEKEVIRKDFKPPYKFIYTGNLVEGKGIFEAIKLIEALNSKGVKSELDIYGDGILKNALNNFLQKKELQKFVKLKGRKSLEELKEAYKKAHFVILLSKSEGWPKTIAEGMWYGCVPVVTPVSCVPWMLGNGSRGILIADLEKREESKEKRGILLNDESQKNPQFECPDENRDVSQKKPQFECPDGSWDVSQKKRQFEYADGSQDVSRTGFSEIDIESIIKLLKKPESLEKMSSAAQEWSQQYTLERFEKGIIEILKSQTINDETQTIKNTPTTDNSNLKTTDDRKPRTDNPPPLGLRPAGSQPTTENPDPTTDIYKQQTPNPKHLRVLQITDTLNPGGAERMAVNLANSLLGEVKASYLCCTREEGMLKEELEEGVGYICLNKKHSLDLQAFWKLRTFIKKKQINFVHAHGTSWFWGVLLKISGLKIKLVWHDHYGESELLDQRNIEILKPLSRYFDGIVSVNTDLKKWAESKLKFNPVIHLNNFITQPKQDSAPINLKGAPGDFKIICVANLRPQKDHFNLIKAFELSAATNPNITLHLVGKDPVSSYSKDVLYRISDSVVADKIYFYGSQRNISGILEQANLGVLASRSEGMPLVLLEYGMAGLPVISTRVGQCSEVLETAGILVPPHSPEELAQAILSFIKNKELCLTKGGQLKDRIKNLFGENSYRQDLLEFYKMI